METTQEIVDRLRAYKEKFADKYGRGISLVQAVAAVSIRAAMAALYTLLYIRFMVLFPFFSFRMITCFCYCSTVRMSFIRSSKSLLDAEL